MIFSSNIRQDFYQGQTVTATNLNQLQNYADMGSHSIVSDILGYGVVAGLNPVALNRFSIAISSGVAYTELGVRLYSEETLVIDISSDRFPDEGLFTTIYLTLSLDYLKEIVYIDSHHNNMQKKWTPIIKPTIHYDKTSITADELTLCEITLDEYGITHIKKLVSRFSGYKQQAIANIVYPINTTYTQYPNDTTELFDETETPKSLFGGVWELVTMKLFNNVPTTHVNSYGVSYIYPDRTLKFVGYHYGSYSGNRIIFEIPFISVPFCHFIHSRQHTAGTRLQLTQETGSDTCSGTRDLTKLGCTVINTSPHDNKTALTAIGYWKHYQDSISEAEEKNYVKIWKRI